MPNCDHVKVRGRALGSRSHISASLALGGPTSRSRTRVTEWTLAPSNASGLIRAVGYSWKRKLGVLLGTRPVLARSNTAATITQRIAREVAIPLFLPEGQAWRLDYEFDDTANIREDGACNGSNCGLGRLVRCTITHSVARMS
jgi:hypothetical protein